MKLSQENRIKRAIKIRTEKEAFNRENTQRYLVSGTFKIKKLITVFISLYVLISFIPYYPTIFETTEIVKYNESYNGGKAGRIIVINTDQGNEYEIQGRIMGRRAFSIGDTIVSCKNILFKTKLILHEKYSVYYPLDKQFVLLILMTSLLVVLFILILSKDFRMERGFNIVVLAVLVLLLLYATS